MKTVLEDLRWKDSNLTIAVVETDNKADGLNICPYISLSTKFQ